MRHRIPWLAALLTCCAGAGAATHEISTAAAFNALNLAPGDEVVWRAGTYAGQTVNFLATGTPEAPITLRAETPGGVVFKGDSRLYIGGAHLVVEGFFWDQATGGGSVVQFRRSGSSTQLARHSVLRNCAFNDLQTAGDAKSQWVMLYGENNTVERCTFGNKQSTGACVQVELAYLGANPAGHVIRGNYFFGFPRKDGRANENDSEGIRVGVSSLQSFDARVVVENNYFVAVDGENEIISNKSRNNVYRRNTFRRCRGALVLRHGAGALVEGNFFLGEGAADSGGIRIIDQDHVVINNYMEGLRGTIWNAGITWCGGNTASGGTSSGYQYVTNVRVAFNTLVDCAQSINMNERSGSRAPASSVLANNLVYSPGAPVLLAGAANLSPAGITFAGNIMAGAPVGYASAGISTADPLLAHSAGLWRPAADGPAADAAAPTEPAVSADVEGRSRPADGRDIGASEVSGATGAAVYRPYSDADIGIEVGCTFFAVPPRWAGYPLTAGQGGFSVADTGAWLGELWIAADWAFAAGPGIWLYVPESHVRAAGAWVALPRPE
jgi:poly(beta-D-mannuronate) lyase